MVLMSTDVETYVKYDGSENNDYNPKKKEAGASFIKQYTLTNEQLDFFDKNKKIGYWYPVLNSKCYTLGCVVIDKKKKPLFFTESEKHFDFLLKYTLKRMNEGHNTYIWGCNHSYDLMAYAQGHFEDSEILSYNDSKGFLMGYLGYTKVFRDEEAKEKRKNRGYLCDTNSLMRAEKSKSLAMIGQALGYPKYKMPREVKDLKELIPYLRRDTEIVLKFIKSINESMAKLGHRPKKILTAGHLSMNYFKHYCNRNNFYDMRLRRRLPYSSYIWNRGRIHQPKSFRNLQMLKNAHRGGRNELYKKTGFKHDKISVLDINSLYPYVMANMKRIPDLLSEYSYDPEFFTIEDTLEKLGVVQASVFFPKTKIGYLPVRYNNGIFFPYDFKNNPEELMNELRDLKDMGCNVDDLIEKTKEKGVIGGIVKGWWTTFELKEAQKVDNYRVLKIHDGVLYRDLPFNPFEKFMKELYEMRRNSEGIMKNVIKLVMNNLHGKFAEVQTTKKRAFCERIDIESYREKGYRVVSDFDDKCSMVRESKPRLSSSAHPIWAVYITAHARDVIYKYLRKIADDDFKDLIYTDTDSLFFLNKNKHIGKFNLSDELGDFKIEWDNQEGLFAKEKVYRIGEKETGYFKIALAGGFSGELSDEQLLGEKPYKKVIKYGISKAMHTGNIEKIGLFIQQEKNIDLSSSKRDVIFPVYYREEANNKLEKERIKREINVGFVNPSVLNEAG